MTDTTTIPRKRGRPRSTLSDAERAERIRVYQRDYGLKRRSENRDAVNAKPSRRPWQSPPAGRCSACSLMSKLQFGIGMEKTLRKN